MLLGVMNRRFFGGLFGVLLILGLLYPYPASTEVREISVGVYYLYHFDEDLVEGWQDEVSEAMEIALDRLNGLDLFEGYGFSYEVVGAFRIGSVEFGGGGGIPEFDGNRTLNRILLELLSPVSDFRRLQREFDVTVFVFPLAKCVSKQFVVISEEGTSPVFLSYNAIVSELRFGRFVIEHEILHKFGLPDRDCEDGLNCRYPDDALSVMAKHPRRLYLSRGDYADFKREGLGETDLFDTAIREGSSKPYRPYLDADGTCPRNVKPTKEWRFIHGE